MWYLFGIMAASCIFGWLFSIPEIRIALSVQNEDVTDGVLFITVIIMSLIWPITLTMLLVDLMKEKK